MTKRHNKIIIGKQLIEIMQKFPVNFSTLDLIRDKSLNTNRDIDFNSDEYRDFNLGSVNYILNDKEN